MAENVTIHCRGCYRPVGVAVRDYAVWCSASCKEMPAATDDEERDSVIEGLARKGTSPTSIALRFDISRQRVHQILQERRVPR